MSDYSEIIYTMVAMVMFSIILLNANRMIHRNTQLQLEGELEKEVVAVAQNIVEESRSVAFDEMTVDGIPPVETPADFTASASFGSGRSDETDENNNDRLTFDDFDDYHDWSTTVTIHQIDFDISVTVTYADPDTYLATSNKTNFKLITVKVLNDYLRNSSDEPINYEFKYIRNYYAD